VFILYNTHTYEIVNLTLSIDTKEFAVSPANISYIHIEHDFLLNLSYAMSIELAMTKGMIASCIKNSEKIMFNLSINEIEKDLQGNIVSKSPYLKKSFNAIFNHDIAMNHVDTKTMERVPVQGDDMDVEVRASFILYNQTELNIMKINDECILDNASAIGALALLFNRRGIRNNVIVTPPLISYQKSMTIPSGDLNSNIQHIHTYYGLYKYIPTLYKSLDYWYLLDLSKPNISMNNFITNTMLIAGDPEFSLDQQMGSRKSQSKTSHEVNILRPPSKPVDNSKLKNIAETANIIAIDAKGKVDIRNQVKDSSTTKVIRKYHELSVDNGLYNSAEYRNEMNRIQLDLLDVSLKIFEPYMRFKFTIHKSYGYIIAEEYSLARCAFKLTRNDNGHFESAVNAELIKL
jgi:hypothetical protein